MRMTPECRRYRALAQRKMAMSRRYDEVFDTTSDADFDAFMRRLDTLKEDVRDSWKECRSSLRRTKRRR